VGVGFATFMDHLKSTTQIRVPMSVLGFWMARSLKFQREQIPRITVACGGGCVEFLNEPTTDAECSNWSCDPLLVTIGDSNVVNCSIT